MPVKMGTGRYFSRGVPASSTSSMVPKAERLISWERQPKESAMPLRETLPLMGQQPVKALARFMAP